MILIKEVPYSIGQVCELLSIENFNLRYIEKTIGLEIKRNNAGERIYSQTDLETIKLIFELKDQGLNYKAIKRVLEHQSEIAADTEHHEEGEGLIIQEEKLQTFMSLIKNTIDESIENKVNSKLEEITNSLETLVKQNQELKKALDHEQERHFIELDKKLTKWREDQQEKQERFRKEQEEKSIPWFKKVFR
ncbi:MAG: MerR family transcriptional regulator [Clostridiaceae bacterium]|nr:MerR family transcriptional regulator [Clostridiaceae bacterium]